MPTSGATRDERGQAGTNIRPVSGPSTGSSKNRPGNRVYRILTSSTVLLFLLFCALQLFLYHANTERTLPASRLFKRAAIAPRAADDDQDDYRSPSYLPYLEWFESSAKSQRIPYVIALLFWLVFLFAVVGIVASDFFCPCLSTISSHLGLSESVVCYFHDLYMAWWLMVMPQAGSTLLAFGNGSPDVFSTFAAMGAQSGSLAIGELLGAASFIISVVAGIMMLVKPFKVSRHVFIRDVAFFMLADILVLVILHDAHITQLEATALVLLYVAYVAVVGFGSWWHARRERQKELLQKARDHFADNDVTTPLRSPDLTPFTDDRQFPRC